MRIPRILVLSVFAALTTIPAVAHSQTSISIAGGVSAPLSDLGNLADLGYNVAAGLNVGGGALPLGVRFEGAYNGLRLKDNSGDVRIIALTANAILNVGKASNAPYLIAGLGAYDRRLNFDNLGSTSDKTLLGINGGGGLRFPLSGITPFFEARYHIMLGDRNDGTNYQFIPITFGVLF
jgi:Outer membrane protein beta-barrel domain